MRERLAPAPRRAALGHPLRLAAAAGAFFALAACGGGAARADFITAADEICAGADAEIAALPEPTTPEEAVEVIDEIRAISERQLAGIRALERPEDDVEKLDAMLALADEQLAFTSDYRAAIAAQDSDRIREIAARIEELRPRAQQAAAAYGFQVCGRQQPTG